MKTTTLAVAAAMAAGTLAHAQDAVQWRVEDGGNGHWYQIQPTLMDWSVARDSAASRGGHLASITSADENTFVFTLITSSGTPNDYWLGGYRTDATCSPPCLEWITGEPWTFEVWTQGDSWGCWNPNPNACGWNGQGTGLALEFNARPETGDAGRWNDESPDLYYNGNIIGCPSVVEWSADCNADGIVDYGQCRDGTLPDYNGNNIPDCCEQGVPCEVGNYPVQWRVEDGGNGHWYLGVPPIASTTWSAARLMAEQQGGYLATFGSQTELAWAVGCIAANSQLWFLSWGPFLGGTQQDGAKSPTSDWSWIDGSEWTPYWGENDCGADDSCGGQSALSFGQCEVSGAISFNDTNIDLPPSGSCTLDARSLLIEFSADCNGDGIVDYGQILLGELADASANGVPDTCECDADINDDDVVNGADISVLLGYWGQSGKNVVGDITGDGIVDGADLAQLLGSWGECP